MEKNFVQRDHSPQKLSGTTDSKACLSDHCVNKLDSFLDRLETHQSERCHKHTYPMKLHRVFRLGRFLGNMANRSALRPEFPLIL